MKTPIITSIILLITAATAMAADGSVYFGLLSGDRQRQPYASTLTHPAKYIAGVEVGHNVWRLRPYIGIETLMDEQERDSFDPSSVRYQVGLKLSLIDGLSLDVMHSCWHPVDRSGYVEVYNQAMVRWEFGR